MSSGLRTGEETRKRIVASVSYINNNLRENADFEKCRNKIYKDAKDIVRMINEIKNYVDNYTTSYCNDMLYDYRILRENVLEAETIEDLITMTRTIVDHHNDNARRMERLSTYDLSSTGKMFNNNDGRDAYNIKQKTINKILQSINFNGKEYVTLFSPQCGYGETEKDISISSPVKIDTYGLDQNVYGADSAKNSLTRVIKGTLKGSTISNDYFDILFLNPRISINAEYKEDGKLKESNEYDILKNSIRYLKDGGIFIMAISYSAFTPEMKLLISKWIKDIKFIKTSDYDTYRHDVKRIIIMGKKSFNPFYSDVFIDLTTYIYDILEEPSAGQYVLDTKSDNSLKIFRGSVLDESELDEILKDDGLYNDFFKSTEIKDNLKDTKPLLPFNIGQIGLILSSGCLDGVVEECDGIKHVIKGMTIKETNTVSETTVNNKGETVINATETISNRVQISAFGADGEFYTLV